MPIVLHQHIGNSALKIVVNDDEVCSQILSIDDFLCKFTSASLYEQDVFGVCLFVFVFVGFAFCFAEKWVIWYSYLSKYGLPVGYFTKIGERVLNVVGETSHCAGWSVDFEECECELQ